MKRQGTVFESAIVARTVLIMPSGLGQMLAPRMAGGGKSAASDKPAPSIRGE